MINTDNQTELWRLLMEGAMSEFAESSHKKQMETIMSMTERTDLPNDTKLKMIYLAANVSHMKL